MIVNYCKKFFSDKNLLKFINFDEFIFEQKNISFDSVSKNSFEYIIKESNIKVINFVQITIPADSEFNLIIKCNNNFDNINRIVVFKIDAMDFSKFNCLNLTAGSVALAFDLLVGKKAQANLYSASKLSNQNKFVLVTKQKHLYSNSASNVISKKFLKDSSYAYYDGNIFISDSADGTMASLKDYSLMLSDQAKTISIPSLEVLNFNVKCKHASATGNIDQNTLWYLSCFGFDQHKAKKILIEAFIYDVLLYFPDIKTEFLENIFI